MRALIQRVSEAAVFVDNHPPARIGQGLVILLGIHQEDTPKDLNFVAEKCAHLRIFADDQGKMNRSLLDVNGDALVVSQFTLYGDIRKGRRPSFISAAAPEKADALYEQFVVHFKNLGIETQTGVFGAHMHVEIHNDGPVTLMVESP